MKFLKSGLVALAVIGLLSGCKSTEKKTNLDKAKEIKAGLANILKEEKAEARKFADAQAKNYYKALKDKDYEAFCKSKKLSKKEFDKWHKAVTQMYGKLESEKYISSISNPLVIRYMWRWTFTRKVKDKTITREALYNVFIAKDKSKNKYILITTGLQ
ncbi:MAG: hypothetical protein WCS27_13305 [Victivallaceae bacterium]